jgi:NifB/MoaA-like Fe-S oxidoreductase
MTSLFLSETDSAIAQISKKKGGRVALKNQKRSVIVCGVSAAQVMKEVAAKTMAAVDGLTVDVLAVENDFFGRTVTCTGLLTGKDMLSALEKHLSKNTADEVLIAGNTMKEFEDVFLCGMTLAELEAALAPYGVKVRVNRDGGVGLVKILRAEK